MAKEKALILALLVGLILLAQSAAHSQNGETTAQPVAIPGADLGLAAVPNKRGNSDHETRLDKLPASR